MLNHWISVDSKILEFWKNFFDEVNYKRSYQIFNRTFSLFSSIEDPFKKLFEIDFHKFQN